MNKEYNIDLNCISYLEEAQELIALSRDNNSAKIKLELASSYEREVEISRMILKEKQRLVEENFKIYHHAKTASNNKEYFYSYVYDPTCVKKRRRITKATESSLILALYEILEQGCYRKDITFKEAFEYAIAAYEFDNPSANTVRKYRADYERFFHGASFEDEEIRILKLEDIKKHTLTLLSSKCIDKKAFMAYKGVLNMIVEYAIEKDVLLKDPRKGFKNKSYYDLLRSPKKNNSSNPAHDYILSNSEVEKLKEIVRDDISKRKYVYYGYAVLFSIYTGVRVAELCALKWSDVDFDNNQIYIHRQQLDELKNGKHTFREVPWTKNEKKLEPDKRTGRYFPMYDDIKYLLIELKKKQSKLEICSEYVFCNESGKYITVREYPKYLKRQCMKLGYSITNNHALRKSLNSNILADKLGLSPTVRAQLLGHSESTNIKFYTYAPRETKDTVLEAFNSIRHAG